MNAFLSGLLLFLPAGLAVFALGYALKRGWTWLELFASITALTLSSYALIFGLATSEAWLFRLGIGLTCIQFVTMVLWPLLSPDAYRQIGLKSLLFDHSSAPLVKLGQIRKSRFLSAATIFFVSLVSILGMLFFVSPTNTSLTQSVWVILLAMIMAVIFYIRWKPTAD